MEDPKLDFQITPKTKIGVLLDRFPHLEKTLMAMAPQFKQLRNPILRKTVAKVASLSQVASIGKVSLPEMIDTLREQAGIKEKFVSDTDPDSIAADKPLWFLSSRIVKTLDARPLLESGEHPVSRVFSECKLLKPGEIFELITPFLPSPLMESAKKQGYLVWSKEEEKTVFKTYITPRTKQSADKT